MFCFVEVEYRVNDDGMNNATALLNVTVLETLNDLISPVAFASEPTTYVNESMHFAYLAARHHSTVKYEIDYGDGTSGTMFDASGSISPIPYWAGAAAANAFGEDIRQCHGTVLEHVYGSVGMYTVHVRVSADQQWTDERYTQIVLTGSVNAVVRPRTLAQLMSTARVYRRLPGYLDEYVVLLFRADEFPESLSLTVEIGDIREPHAVRKMSGDSVPSWFAVERSKDITTRKSVPTGLAVNVSSHNPFFGVDIGKQFERPGTYDVRFLVKGTLPNVEAPQRVLIVGRLDVVEERLESQLAGGPLLFAHSPVISGTTTELLVIVRRLIRGVVFSVDFGDGMSQAAPVDVFQVSDLPGWLLAGTFSSTEPFLLTGSSVTYYGRIVRHMFREPGVYAAVVKASVSLGNSYDMFTSPATAIHVVDHSVPPLTDLLGDDALVMPTPLLTGVGFQALYMSTHNVARARYTFVFGDGTVQKEGRICSEWPHVNHSIHAIAGRLPLDMARQGTAETAVCISHVYARPGSYTVHVRVHASPSGVSQRTWNIGGRVTVLQTTTVSSPYVH